ncbi:YmfQ family protein [Sneathiella sp.]|mgnify:CR=1 FL=1|uniref:YmfQ family protein n=1 Tax=Sneathiella sp. TaxID=1964365 RepID=UPI002FE1FCD2
MASETEIARQVNALRELLPGGLAWPRERNTVLMSLVEGLAVEFANIEERIAQLEREADPREASILIDDWEIALGLPDDCVTYAPVFQERRAAILQRYLSTGGQSRSFFEGLAEDLGYPVTITECKPLCCGDFLVDPLGGGPAQRHYWFVTVHEPRVTYARTGASNCGDFLATLRQAEDLECLFQQLKPAHTILTFFYEETE